MGEAAKAMTLTTLVLMLIIQVFASQMIKFIWPLFNTVQLILATVHLAIQMPANADMVLRELKGIIELGALKEPKENLKAMITNSDFMIYILNLDPIMMLVMLVMPFVFIVIALILTIACCLKKWGHKCPCCARCGNKIVTTLKDKLMYTVPLRSLIVAYL